MNSVYILTLFIILAQTVLAVQGFSAQAIRLLAASSSAKKFARVYFFANALDRRFLQACRPVRMLLVRRVFGSAGIAPHSRRLGSLVEPSMVITGARRRYFVVGTDLL